MLVYSVLFIFILLLSLFMPKDTNKQKKIYLFLCFGSMVLVAGLRKYTIGIDLVELYAPKYIQICHTSFANLQFVHMEYGYVLFNKLLSLISTDVQLLIFTTSLIIYGSYGYFIYKNSKNVAFSTILFIIISLFFMSMNIIRQELSVAFLLIGYEFLKKKKYLAFYIIAFVATLFHQSSIIAFLFPLFYKTKFKKSYFFIGLVVAAVGFVFSTPLINGFTNLISLLGLNNNKDYTMYLSSKAFGVPIINLNSLSGLLLSIAYFVLCYYYFCILKDEKNFDETDNYSLFMIFFYSLFSILSFKMVIIARFQYYFSPFILCAIPNAIKSSKFKSNIAFITSFIIVFVGAKFLYIFLYLADDLYGVMPFTFFWQ